MSSATGVQRHPYHLVDQSPWPLFTGISTFILTTGSVAYMHNYAGGGYIFALGVLTLIGVAANWFRDVVREATFQGHHTKPVQNGLKEGMILFIVSEVMFFVAFFWAFFHSSIAPTIEIGSIWPPAGIETLDAFEVPLLNTIILLSSGATCTWAHLAMVEGNRSQVLAALFSTVTLGLLFSVCQAYEYIEAQFTISDGIYGSTFFMSTGFHGFHVLIGTTFLAVCLYRAFRGHFTTTHHLGFEAAAWYWHFVDVVWLFLFVSIYYWGGN